MSSFVLLLFPNCDGCNFHIFCIIRNLNVSIHTNQSSDNCILSMEVEKMHSVYLWSFIRIIIHFSIKREEAKITAWENLQKAIAEAAVRKLEVLPDCNILAIRK